MPHDELFTIFPVEWGPELWKEEHQDPALIEGVLWQGDAVMLLGSEKAGKSIIGMQMAFNLTTGQAFLDKYKIPSAVPILFIQTEGKKNEMRERMKRMREAVAVEDANFFHLFQRFLPLDSARAVDKLIETIEQLPVKPKVIFIDSLYTSMMGDLTDNAAIRALLAQLSRIVNRFYCALVIIHHETKEQWEAGRLVDRGDRSSYGSVFLRAWVEHILYLKRHTDKSRTFTCDTQRSGKVLEKEELILTQPEPLLFESKGDFAPYVEVVKRKLIYLAPAYIFKEELIKQTELSSSAIEKSITLLERRGLVEREYESPGGRAKYRATNKLLGDRG